MKKKKKSITIWGYNEGSNLATTTTVPQISIEVFWQVNFEPLTIPPNCDGFFFFCSILFHLPRPTTYQKESRNSFADPISILIEVRHNIKRRHSFEHQDIVLFFIGLGQWRFGQRHAMVDKVLAEAADYYC